MGQFRFYFCLILLSGFHPEVAWSNQDSKQEICGDRLSLAFEHKPSGEFKLLHSKRADANEGAVCLLNGHGPNQSNYRIELFNDKKRQNIYFSQKFFIQNIEFYDGDKKKDPSAQNSEGEKGGVAEKKRSFFKNFSVPLPDSGNQKSASPISFKILDLATGKNVGEGVIP